MVSHDITLPDLSELEVPEIKVSSPLLRAVGPHMGLACDTLGKEFMLCSQEERDPRKCLKEGKEVTACGLRFLQRVKANCREEAEAFAKCLEWTSEMSLNLHCRKESDIMDACFEKKLNSHRPPFGYFCQLRLHDTNRPKPVPFVPEFPDRTTALSPDYEGLQKEARHGPRHTLFP